MPINRKPTLYSTGFSLIELLIAISLMMILGLLAVPSITPILQKNKIKSQADLFLAKIQDKDDNRIESLDCFQHLTARFVNSY